MRENRPYGSEGGEAEKPSLPLSCLETTRLFANNRLDLRTTPRARRKTNQGCLGTSDRIRPTNIIRPGI
jgi:hypothetical protein